MAFVAPSAEGLYVDGGLLSESEESTCPMTGARATLPQSASLYAERTHLDWWHGNATLLPYISSLREVTGPEQVWDSQTLQCLRTLEGHEDNVRVLAVGDSYVFSGSWDKSIRSAAVTYKSP